MHDASSVLLFVTSSLSSHLHASSSHLSVTKKKLCVKLLVDRGGTDKATLRVIGICGLVVAVGLGVVSFLISSNDRRRLHPWMLISCQLSAY